MGKDFGRQSDSVRSASAGGAHSLTSFRDGQRMWMVAVVFMVAAAAALFLWIQFQGGVQNATPAYAQQDPTCPAPTFPSDPVSSQQVYATTTVTMSISWTGVPETHDDFGYITGYQTRYYPSTETHDDSVHWYPGSGVPVDGTLERQVDTVEGDTDYTIEVQSLCLIDSLQSSSDNTSTTHTTAPLPEPCNDPASLSLSSVFIQDMDDGHTEIMVSWGAADIPSGHTDRYLNYEIRFKESSDNFSGVGGGGWDSVDTGTTTYTVPDDYEGGITLVEGTLYDFELRMKCHFADDDYYSRPALTGTITAAEQTEQTEQTACISLTNLALERRVGGFIATWDRSEIPNSVFERVETRYKKTTDTSFSEDDERSGDRNLVSQTVSGLDELTSYDFQVRLKCKTAVEAVYSYSIPATATVVTEATRIYEAVLLRDGIDAGNTLYEGEVYLLNVTMQDDQPVYNRDVDITARFALIPPGPDSTPHPEHVTIVDSNTSIPAVGATNQIFASRTLRSGERFVSWAIRLNCDDIADDAEVALLFVQLTNASDGAVDFTSSTLNAAGGIIYFREAETPPCANASYAPGNVAATGSVSISGTVEVGSVLTADHTISDPNGLPSSFNYQWHRDGTAISGETGSTYSVTADDAGTDLHVVVSFTDEAGNSESLASSPVTVPGVVAPTPNATGVVEITNDLTPAEVNGRVAAELHQPLMAAVTGLSDPDGLSNLPTSNDYTWHRLQTFHGDVGGPYSLADPLERWAIIKTNATRLRSTVDTFTPRSEDGVVDQYIVACVHFQDDAGTLEHLCSDPTAQVPYGPDIDPRGARFVGQTLTAYTSDMNYVDLPSNPSFTYQWSWEDDSRAHEDDIGTAETYEITEADIGKFINLDVTYTNMSGDSVTKPANSRTGPIAPPIIGPAGLTARVSGGIVTLSWSLDPAGSGDTPTGFEYCYTPTSVGNCVSGPASLDWTSVSGSARSVTIRSLINNVEYRFEVRSTGGGFTSDEVPTMTTYLHRTRVC